MLFSYHKTNPRCESAVSAPAPQTYILRTHGPNVVHRTVKDYPARAQSSSKRAESVMNAAKQARLIGIQKLGHAYSRAWRGRLERALPLVRPPRDNAGKGTLRSPSKHAGTTK